MLTERRNKKKVFYSFEMFGSSKKENLKNKETNSLKKEKYFKIDYKLLLNSKQILKLTIN